MLFAYVNMFLSCCYVRTHFGVATMVGTSTRGSSRENFAALFISRPYSLHVSLAGSFRRSKTKDAPALKLFYLRSKPYSSTQRVLSRLVDTVGVEP